MILSATNLRAAETKTAPERIGVYDSRVVAYAHFWTEGHMRKIKEMANAAKEAEASGQTERYKELSANLKKEQEQSHLQVFSTAPVDDILAGMKNRVDAIQKEAGVSRLLSKWDEKTLKGHKPAQQVEVTDLLLREFKLNEKQLKVVANMRKQEPPTAQESPRVDAGREALIGCILHREVADA